MAQEREEEKNRLTLPIVVHETVTEKNPEFRLKPEMWHLWMSTLSHV